MNKVKLLFFMFASIMLLGCNNADKGGCNNLNSPDDNSWLVGENPYHDLGELPLTIRNNPFDSSRKVPTFADVKKILMFHF